MLPPELLVSLCTIVRGKDAADGYGGTLPLDTADPTQLTTIAKAVPCRVASPSTRQKYRNDLKGVEQDVENVVVFMDYRPDILVRDRFIVEADPANNPGVLSYYDSQNIKDPGLMHHHLEISVQVIS